jgi:succinate dehydrogenase / fumarate reductase, cytochrome b subunit
MKSVSSFFCSTLGRKQIMAVAGLSLCLFVLGHVLGNFLMFIGPEAYNMYGYKLTSTPLIYVAEAGLLVMIVLHIVEGILVTRTNMKARPQNYAVYASGEKRTSYTQRTMMWQGSVILAFVVLHLITFKYGEVYTVRYGDQEVRDLFRLVYEVFQSPGYVAWYIIAVAILGFHLSHGFYSSVQTLGFNHPAYTPKIKSASVIYGIIIGVGFAIQPIYMMFIYKA